MKEKLPKPKEPTVKDLLSKPFGKKAVKITKDVIRKVSMYEDSAAAIPSQNS
jgi:hypothetical protein